MLNDIHLLISIVLGILSIFLTILNIFQFFENRSRNKILENILATAHNALEGINYSLNQIISNAQKFSQKEDIINSLTPLSAFINSMTQAIEEQRFYDSSKEVKRSREKSKLKIEKFLSKLKKDNEKN